MELRDLSEILLDMINDKTIQRVTDRLRGCDAPDPEAAETRAALVATEWRRALSAMKAPATDGSDSTNSDTIDALAKGAVAPRNVDERVVWRLAERVPPLPILRTQQCLGTPPQRAKRPRAHNQSSRGLLYGFLKVARSCMIFIGYFVIIFECRESGCCRGGVQLSARINEGG